MFNIMNPQCNEQISPVPWHFLKSRFHCVGIPLFIALHFELTGKCNSRVTNYSPIGKCHNSCSLHHWSFRKEICKSCSWRRYINWKSNKRWYCSVYWWMELRAWGDRWFNSLLLTRLGKCCVQQCHWWLGVQVRQAR